MQKNLSLYLASFAVCIFLTIKVISQPLTADANTLLLLHFDNALTGAAGEMPLSSSNISYTTGKLGAALSIASSTTLRFDTTQNFNPRQGTLEFWIKPLTEGVALDMGIGGGLSAQVGFYTRMIFNIFGINGKPEVGVIGDYRIWKPGTWYHLAFTWENRELKLYYNSSLFASTTINFDIPNINLAYFNIGSTIGGSYQLQGLLDELRISNRARTQQEICQSYLSGQNLGAVTNLAVRNTTAVTLYKTWKLHLQKDGYWKVPSVYTLNGADTVNIKNTCIDWSVTNTSVAELANGVVNAKNAGSTTLIGTFGGQTVSISINVVEPVKAPEYEANIDPFLTTPASCYANLVPVLVIVHLPTKDGIYFDEDEVPGYSNQLLTKVKNDALKIFMHTKFSLEEGSKFRGYSNPAATPFLGYKVVDYIYIYEPLPLSIQDNPALGNYWVDYYQIVERNMGKHYVETMGVKEIWLMGYHTNKVSPLESNMASRTTGNISNSYRREDDLPKYNKTYIVYNSNITRSGNESTHNHGHQIEAMCDYVARKQDGNTDLFHKKFRGVPISGTGGPLGRCGDTHHPPNSQTDYDYENSTLVASDILDWKPAGGAQSMVNYLTWANIPYAWPSGLSHTPESNWYILWMQSIPGNGNKIPYGTKWMTNWWRFMSDWDSTTVKIGLYQNNMETNQTTCFPTAVIDLNTIEQVKLFPNPVHDKLLITRSVNNISTAIIRLFDMTGREMKRTTSNSLQTEIDMSPFSPGTYILWIEDKANKINGRKMITKQ